jgi:hypothetical protein
MSVYHHLRVILFYVKRELEEESVSELMVVCGSLRQQSGLNFFLLCGVTIYYKYLYINLVNKNGLT